ncbi:putative mitochondrial 32 kDa ER-associated protein (ERAP32) [Leptomonas pyrrhocoris]|uniref:Putative mitochondrial 32 kDa ER-associated protein (ERAP32) n=1 Tax=Leptomonas pyrrhocoris TaxID=157538 RepID=A0A0M9G3C7_LEPPY|nr:putative mitochondrial 32 kDa ER-associated protein (ERAP32) [Leptomonas pyrrhocoris]XP_015660020.1 putative mitochondrial 32 kDa ER-associated protein (ERAP32) [Leptomonas pyrrhocoris]XP_015660021.1 putative mitochondrial 32 kDa ER-associated protein (ERAP32) [Leptomonas pyrrhocoris]KPA81580.1 putative mitochondrial 32 kDa ER-associated protein (ERAP32) [Leptomonas pyrrhocoris]KPA81581.1 putative mitochondrial 32 kDa ER-associated protein (ERAP32) [Leptomonas pyrrhocoris]KPA81582.1 putativ|eukprot:XP_015660019.1 putative mitochondrial 32 kDa ER-associated protein (ERAP32) [Leptomonas pyrrhocoris]
MVQIPKSITRLCGAALGAHLAMTSSVFLCSSLGHDDVFEQHWNYSRPTLRKRVSYVAFWTPGFFSPVLSGEERECLDVWMHTLALHTPLFATIQISPKITVQDSMAVLQGISELRDGVYLLEKLPIAVEPYLQEVRREYQDDVVFLHGKTRTDIAFKVPFTHYKVPLFVFPASFTLQLERTHSRGPHLNITVVEHRWFNGLLLSHSTNSVSSPWGDVGDLCRRYNGFLWSGMATKKISLGERRRAFIEKTTRMEEELKRQQEEQIKI